MTTSTVDTKPYTHPKLLLILSIFLILAAIGLIVIYFRINPKNGFSTAALIAGIISIVVGIILLVTYFISKSKTEAAMKAYDADIKLQSSKPVTVVDVAV